MWGRFLGQKLMVAKIYKMATLSENIKELNVYRIHEEGSHTHAKNRPARIHMNFFFEYAHNLL